MDTTKLADILLKNGSEIDVSRNGDAGIVVIKGNTISLDNSRIVNGTFNKGKGDGRIDIEANKDIILNHSQIQSITRDEGGNAASIVVSADNSIQLQKNSEITSVSDEIRKPTQGNSGSIQIATGSLLLRDNSTVGVETRSEGDAGRISIQATHVSLEKDSKILSFSGKKAPGVIPNAGDIDIRVNGALTFADTSRINARTFGKASAGNVTIVTDSLTVTGPNSGLFTNAELGSSGDGGNITITANRFEATNGGQLNATTSGSGKAGDITTHVTGTLTLTGANSGLFAKTEKDSSGTGGNIILEANRFEAANGGQLSATTSGSKKAGDITANVTDSLTLTGANSGLFVKTEKDSSGTGGNITVTANRFEATNGGQLNATTDGSGNAGGITTTVKDRLTLTGTNSRISSSTSSAGDAKNITVTAPTLIVKDGAQISAATSDRGAGGSITVNADRLEATNGGQLNTTTSSSGQAGNITANVIHSVTLTGANSGLFASTTERSTGDGGNITIDPRVVLIQDGAKVAVNSDGDGRGGDIRIQAGKLILRDRGSITAATASGEGGDIALNVQDLLLLRQGSEISSKASNAGNGGNVLINNLPGYKGFVVAVPSENSDIRADAFLGNGGNITINSNGVYGFLPKQQGRLDTPFSDINASSALGINGTVTISTLEIDPSRGLAVIPVDLVDPSGLISQQCAPSGKQASSSFVATGQGGLPPNPTGVLGGETVIIRLATLEDHQTGQPTSMQAIPVATKPVHAIVEAQGWVTRSDGVVTLVAEAPATTPKSLWVRVPSCQH
nr:S-layer family protein [Stenomitos frigidus]